MRPTLALILYYSKGHKYSFNALLGALEADPSFDLLPLYLPETEAELLEALRKAVAAHELTVCGLSLFSPEVPARQKLLARLKNEFPARTMFIAGGPHPSADPVGTLQLGFDLAVRGEAEETLGQLLHCFSTGRDHREIRGLAWLDSAGACRLTEPATPVELDRYSPFAPRSRKFGPLEITRGCPFACGFCQTTFIFGARPRHRSVDLLTQSARCLVQSRLPHIRFITPNAFAYGSADGKTVNLGALERLLSALRQTISASGQIFCGTFPSEVRPEQVSAEAVRLVRQFANNDNLLIGAQSGSPRLLETCRRGHTVGDIERAVKTAADGGLRANVDFIFGLPGENEDDRARTVELMQRLIRLGARIHAHTFMPLPQTAFAHEPAGRIEPRLRQVLHGFLAKGQLYGTWTPGR